MAVGFISFIPGIKINAASATDAYTSETMGNGIGTVGIVPYAEFAYVMEKWLVHYLCKTWKVGLRRQYHNK